MEPQIRYATTRDGVSIAYYAIGAGPPMLVLLLPASHLEAEWQLPPMRAAFMAAAQRNTFIRLDPRGFGLSDRNVADLSLDAMASDIEAVVESLGLDQLAIYGIGAFTSMLAIRYSALHPDKVTHLILNAAATGGTELGPKRFKALRTLASVDWELATDTAARASYDLPDAVLRGLAEVQRASIDGDSFLRFWDEALKWDAQADAKSLRVPTLVIQDRSLTDPEFATATRRTAGIIPDARLAFVTGPFSAAPVVRAFLTGEQQPESPAPVEDIVPPATTQVIMFADIVDSTALTETLGDSAFRSEARRLDEALRAVIGQLGGKAIDGKLVGDGVLAVFTSASQAIAAAGSCRKASEVIGLPLHLGLHAGDVIEEDGNVFGGAVNIAARIAGESAAGEVLVSETVRSLARTSAGVTFEDAGERDLKGVGEPVRVWRVVV